MLRSQWFAQADVVNFDTWTWEFVSWNARATGSLPKKVTLPWNWQPFRLYFILDYFQTTTLKGNYLLLALVFPQLWGAAALLESCHSHKEQPRAAKSKFCPTVRILFLGKAHFPSCSAEMLHPFITLISQSWGFFCRKIPSSCSLDWQESLVFLFRQRNTSSEQDWVDAYKNPSNTTRIHW